MIFVVIVLIILAVARRFLVIVSVTQDLWRLGKESVITRINDSWGFGRGLLVGVAGGGWWGVVVTMPLQGIVTLWKE